MSIFDMLAKAATGGNSKRDSGCSSNYVSSSYNRNRTPTMMYQCRYCGQRKSVTDPAYLPRGSRCMARGTDTRNKLDHVWERL